MFGNMFKRPQGLGMFGGQPETYEGMGGMGPQAAPAMGGQGGFQMANPQAAMMGLGMLSGRNNAEAFGGAMKGAALAHEMSQPKGGSMWTEKMKNFAFAKQQGFDGSFQDWMRQEGTDSELGLIPQYGRDKDGNPVIFQIGKDGQAKQTKLPDGMTLDPGWVKQTQAQGAAVGKARGEAQAELPGQLTAAEHFLGSINDVRDDPNRSRGTGKSAVFNAMPGTAGFDFQQKVDQLKGKSFIEAYQGLKGGGAISEAEGMKAEQAIARLNTAQSEEAFAKGLDDLEEVVKMGMKRARTKAGVQPVQAAPGAADPLGLR
jgi:hypothetical protein